MGAGSSLYDVPRPNPKNPLLNKCTPFALTTEQVLNKTGLNEKSVVDAEFYCNPETENPPLVAGFSSFSALAEQNPAKYGSLLYRQIKTDLEKNMNPLIANRSFNVFDSPTEIKAVLAYAAGLDAAAIVAFNQLYAQLQNLLRLIGNNAKEFANFIARIFPSGLLKEILGFAFNRVIAPTVNLAIFIAREIIKNPVKAIAKFAAATIKLSVKGVVFLGKKVATSISNLLARNLATLAGFAAGDVLEGLVVRKGGEQAAKAAAAGLARRLVGSIARFGAKALASAVAALSIIGNIFNLVGIGLLLYDIAKIAINLIGRTTIKYEISYCNFIGDRFEGDEDGNTEWAVLDNEFEFGGCFYNSASRGYKVGTDFGCGTKGDCAIRGAGLRCVRQNFRADPFVCCLQDHSCNTSDEDTCFQTPDRQRTCHPLFRDLSSNYCRDIIFDYCAGDILLPDQNDWMEMWAEDSFVNINSKMSVENNVSIAGRYNQEEDINRRGRQYPIRQKQPCVRAIARAVSTAKICNFEELQEIDLVEGSFNSEGFVWSKRLLERAFERYRGEGGSVLGGINTDGINRNSSFYNTLWTICNKIPGLCTNILDDMCSDYTTEQVANSPFLTPWCSCYLPEAEYQKYSVFGIKRPCTPLCNRTNVIPPVTATGQQDLCQQSVCMIDETTVDIINSQFDGGSININQICASCGQSNVKTEYNYGSLLETSDIDSSYFIDPPKTNNGGNYTQVYGSGFDLTLSRSQVSLIIPPGDFPEIYKNKLSSYPQCILSYAENVTNEDVGVISINVINLGGGKISKGTYVLGYGIDGLELFDKLNGTRAEVTISQFKNSAGVERSKNTTRWGQSRREASLNTCSCITSGLNISVIDSKISGKINFTQECGKSICYDENNRQIACSSEESNPDPVDTISSIESKVREELEKDKLFNMFFSAAGLAVIAIIFFVAVFFYKSCFKIIYVLLDKLSTGAKK